MEQGFWLADMHYRWLGPKMSEIGAVVVSCCGAFMSSNSSKGFWGDQSESLWQWLSCSMDISSTIKAARAVIDWKPFQKRQCCVPLFIAWALKKRENWKKRLILYTSRYRYVKCESLLFSPTPPINASTMAEIYIWKLKWVIPGQSNKWLDVTNNNWSTVSCCLVSKVATLKWWVNATSPDATGERFENSGYEMQSCRELTNSASQNVNKTRH